MPTCCEVDGLSKRGCAAAMRIFCPITLDHCSVYVLKHLHVFGDFLRQKGRGSPYSITERRVPELIPVLGSQPAGDVGHKPDGRLPLLSARPAVTLAILKRAATSFAFC